MPIGTTMNFMQTSHVLWYMVRTIKLSRNLLKMGRAKRIWYLSPMRAAKVQALIQAVSQEEPSDRKPDPWLGMRS